jgi:hypothetical protein
MRKEYSIRNKTTLEDFKIIHENLKKEARAK